MSYTKLFNSIVTSTIWREADTTRIVWITMLACADKNGEVQASIPGLAHIAGVSVDACKAAIDRFLSPDPYSRTRDDEGRRIEEIDGGWLILNYVKYRQMASDEDRKAKAAERQRRFREKKSRNSNAKSNASNATVTLASLQNSQAEAEADTVQHVQEKESTSTPHPSKAKKAQARNRASLTEIKDFCTEIGLPESDGEACFYKWEGNGWLNGGKPIKDWRATIRAWKASGYMPSQKTQQKPFLCKTGAVQYQDPRDSNQKTGEGANDRF